MPYDIVDYKKYGLLNPLFKVNLAIFRMHTLSGSTVTVFTNRQMGPYFVTSTADAEGKEKFMYQ